MSSVIKGIGKVFKSIVKVAKVVLPIALAVGAVVFTAGAALGVPAMAGGWGGAMTSVFGSSTIGNVLAGAATQAGYGAAMGAATSAVTGGNVMKGMQTGAAVGAVTGGITGWVSPHNIDPLKGVFSKAPDAAAAPNASTLSAAEGGVGNGPASGNGILASNTPAASPAGGPPNYQNQPNTNNSGGGGGGGGDGGSANDSWINKNGLLVGGLVQGAGNAISGVSQSNAERDISAQDKANIRENYGVGNADGTGNGLLTQRTFTPYTGGQTPQERFTPSYGGEYQWDPNTRRVVFVPKTNQTQPGTGTAPVTA